MCSGILARQWKLRVFLGIFTHHIFPETLMTPIHTRLPLTFHIHYSVKHKSAASCSFFFHLHFSKKDIQCCQHYGQLKDKIHTVTHFVAVLPTWNCQNSQKCYNSISNMLMERHQFTWFWKLGFHLRKKVKTTQKKCMIGLYRISPLCVCVFFLLLLMYLSAPFYSFTLFLHLSVSLLSLLTGSPSLHLLHSLIYWLLFCPHIMEPLESVVSPSTAQAR